MPSRDTESLSVDQPLFPVSGRVPGGTERKTHKMIERDLMAARDQWLDEAKTELTLGVYTHVELHHQTAAIEALPASPSVRVSRDDDA